MTYEKFECEKAYHITLHIVRAMVNDGLLTEDEMHIIDTMLKEKYNPLLGFLYP